VGQARAQMLLVKKNPQLSKKLKEEIDNTIGGPLEKRDEGLWNEKDNVSTR